jgi:hypothetical protein
MEKRFRGLGIIGFVLKIIGVLELVVGIASVILIPLVLSNADSAVIQFGLPGSVPGVGLIAGLLLGTLVFLFGIVCGLLTFSMGELFNVFIAIEENTHNTVVLLQSQK